MSAGELYPEDEHFEYPTVPDSYRKFTVETMAPNEIIYLKVGEESAPIAQDEHGRLYLLRDYSYRQADVAAPDFAEPFVGIMRVLKPDKATDRIMHGYIADIRGVGPNLIPTIDRRELDEEDAEEFAEQVVGIFGIISDDEGATRYAYASKPVRKELKYLARQTEQCAITLEVEELAEEAHPSEPSRDKAVKKPKRKAKKPKAAAPQGVSEGDEPAEDF